MAVFQEVVIEWQGKEYRVTPNMKLINRVEQDVSLSSLALRASTGDVPFSHVAVVYAHLINAGGGRVTSEEVWQAMATGKKVESAMQALDLALTAFFPISESQTELVDKEKKTAEK